MTHRLAIVGDRAVRVAGIVAWSFLAISYVTVSLIASSDPGVTQSMVAGGLVAFFVLLLGWIVIAMIAQPRRRRSLRILVVSIAFWAAGSAVLNANTQPDLTKFPSPGEWLFLVSYVALAAYLITDAGHRVTRTTLSAWLETVVICGATVCVAGAVLLSPVASQFNNDGVPLLVALLYPLIDVALGVLVVAQIMLRARGGFRHSGVLILVFALFAYADAHFVGYLSAGVYDSSLVNDSCYGIAFALLVTQACQQPFAVPDVVPRRQRPAFFLIAGLAALAVLVFHPADAVGKYLVAVALITLLAVGGRLVVALNEANRAAEAYALARSDDLTSLPNRRAVLALIAERLAAHQPFSLMILDLNGFKDVNDTLGHAAGDAVLQLVAHRMRTALDPGIMVARLGGDEFAAVVPGPDQIEAMAAAQSILRALRQPLTVEGISIGTDASIGVTTSAASDTKSGELLRRADVAMYQAKVNRAGALVYDAHFDHFSREKLQIAEELRKGILFGQLELWYQPQIDAETQRIGGLEALVRWQHPKEGLLSPAVFLPAARRAGLMPALSAEVVRIALSDLAEWRTRGLDPRVAINCAPPELMSGSFLPALYKAMEEADVPASSLVIEVTEDSFLNEPERARSVLLDIRRHGMQISIDDYGTGFSSLSYLRDLPVQELKIDSSFITAMRHDPRSQMIVASTLQMAKALGLRTVAEGVEDSATAADLVAMGVDVLQGYHLSRPLRPTQVETWMREWTTFADITYETTPRAVVQLPELPGDPPR
ncbi:diguanylate cyclase (GGDEF)-like protein [Jatrophihabitans sp. GAS493]|nr:diguanylate cyclase (GGDEF)-like protein [Jatrophihabitans sp. GAS493]